MPNVIIIPAGSIAGVKVSTKFSALEPVLLKDGRGIVGPEVLADSVFATKKSALQGMSVVDYATLSDVVSKGGGK